MCTGDKLYYKATVSKKYINYKHNYNSKVRNKVRSNIVFI